MATLPGMQGEVFYGDVDRPLPDWRANLSETEGDSDEPTQEEMDAAVSMLGFDPSEELRRMEEQETAEVPKQKTKKLVSRLPKKKL